MSDFRHVGALSWGALVLGAAFVIACGGKSVSTNGIGDAGSAGTTGGVSTTGGNSSGGGVGVGGVPATGGTGTGGTAGDTCSELDRTYVTGTVRDPAGHSPMYDVAVYVPGGPLAPMPEGIDCDACDFRIEPRPVFSTLTDSSGRFHLEVPPGPNIPLVMQIGKWRRQIIVPFVNPCVENVLDDADLTRLPRSQSEGNMPRIAVVTGREDSVECLLRRIGIADSEFTLPGEGGTVSLFVGCDGGAGTGADRFADSLGSAPFPKATERLFGAPSELAQYDHVLLGCEGRGCADEKAPYLENLEGYVNGGGRLVLDHLQNVWIKNGSAALRSTAIFDETHEDHLQSLFLGIDMTFPKGAALAEWLINAGASATLGEVYVHEAGASVQDVSPSAQRWLYQSFVDGTFAMTVNTPVDVAEHLRCGRIIYNDFHAYAPAGEQSRSDVPFPNGCRSDSLSPQEAVFEFLLFYQRSCIDRGADPMPPL